MDIRESGGIVHFVPVDSGRIVWGWGTFGFHKNKSFSMEETKKHIKMQICHGCLNSNSEYLRPYRLQVLKANIQVEELLLCHICRKLAQRAEIFIRNIRSNQILLENFDNLSISTLKSATSQTQLFSLTHRPLYIIDLADDSEKNADETFTVVELEMSKYESPDKVNVKVEIKQEFNDLLDNSETAFDDDHHDFQDLNIKSEDEFPLKKNLRRKVKATKEKKLKKIVMKENDSEDVEDERMVETVYITRDQCIEERDKNAQDIHYLNSKYKCVDCVKWFSFKGSYDTHMETHSKSNGEFECDICKRRMISEEKLISHRRYHEIRYKCRECDLTRVCRQTIKDHYRATHSKGNNFYCIQCGKFFKKKRSLSKHVMYTHNKQTRVTCNHCNKTYANTQVLKNHMVLRHPKEVSADIVTKNFFCTECGVAFRSSSHLKSHMLKHSTSRDYYCVECDKSFKSVYVLKQHLETTLSHVGTRSLPFECEFCDKRFTLKRELNRHKNRVHLNVRPFQCDQCEKTYVDKWPLTQHKRIKHEGYKRPLKYPCHLCDKIFDRNSILKSHIRTHTGEKPYQCSECPAQFSQRSILGTHYKLIHLKLTRDGRPKIVALK